MILRPSLNRPRTLETDMTPLIDVVFQLLIFFLTTTQLAALSRVDLDLPKEQGQGERSTEEPGLIVNLRDDGTLVVLDEEVSLSHVATLAARSLSQRSALAATLRPVVRADRRAPAQALNTLLAALRDAGVEGVTLAVSPGG